MKRMNPQDSDNQIQKHEFPYKYKLDLKKEKYAVLSKVKYVTDRSEYDILDKDDFENFLDYLSLNSTGKLCPQQVKTLVWNSCQKQARGGILIRNIMQFVARYLLNEKPTDDLTTQLSDVFIKSEFRQKEFKQEKQQRKFYTKEIVIGVLSFISGGGVSYLMNSFHQNIKPVETVKQLTKEVIESGAQRNRLLYPSVEPLIAVGEAVGNGAAGNYGSVANNARELFGKVAKGNVVSRVAEQSQQQISSITQKVIRTPQVNNLDVIQNSDAANVSGRFSFAYIQSVFKKVFSFIEGGYLTILDFCKGLLLEKNQFGQTDKFYISLNMFNLFQAVQVAGLVWAVSLMCRKQKTKKQKAFKIDKLFYS